MSRIDIRRDGAAGRITLTRPDALNALDHDMALAIERALDDWRNDAAIRLVLLDGAGDKAFCAGGDIGDMYRRGMAGDVDYGRQFWRDEYRMNAKIADYPKPVLSVLHGYVMGGGVGIGCHGSHRIVCESARIAMPECAIGLIPDVGGSLLLSRAPGRLGAFLGLTGARMGPGDAIVAKFADIYVEAAVIPRLKSDLCKNGDVARIAEYASDPPESSLPRGWIDTCFAADDLTVIRAAVAASDPDDPAARDACAAARAALDAGSPLSMAATLEILRRHRIGDPTIRDALELEYRFTYRAMDQGDFLEGVRAAIIDKDRTPIWRRGPEDAKAMLAPLGKDALWEENG